MAGQKCTCHFSDFPGHNMVSCSLLEKLKYFLYPAAFKSRLKMPHDLAFSAMDCLPGLARKSEDWSSWSHDLPAAP
jgi:hypothetical protein